MRIEIKHEVAFDVKAITAQARENIDEALRQGVEIVVADAKAAVHPFRRTGKGEDSIGGEVENGVAWVWAKKFYMRWFEFGSRHQRARPFLRPAIVGAKARIKALLAEAVHGAWAGEKVLRAAGRKPTASAAPPPSPEPPQGQQRQDRSAKPKRPRTREEWKAYGHWKKHGTRGGVDATGRSTRQRPS